MSGKWNNPDFPHLGWVCLEVYDSLDGQEAGEELYLVCEMCEVQLIRYVHVMAHDHMPEPLEVGCICAGHMEGDVARAQHRERLAGRRSRFPRHKLWFRTMKGGWSINVERHRIVIFHRGEGWKVVVENLDQEDGPVWGRKIYGTEHEAKLGAFDALIYMQGKHH